MKNFADVHALAERILEASDVDRTNLPDHGAQELFFAYAQLALQKGPATTNEDVHEIWRQWATKYEPGSRYLVPYDQLPQAVQDKDTPFTIAIQHAAYGLSR